MTQRDQHNGNSGFGVSCKLLTARLAVAVNEPWSLRFSGSTISVAFANYVSGIVFHATTAMNGFVR